MCTPISIYPSPVLLNSDHSVLPLLFCTLDCVGLCEAFPCCRRVVLSDPSSFCELSSAQPCFVLLVCDLCLAHNFA